MSDLIVTSLRDAKQIIDSRVGRRLGGVLSIVDPGYAHPRPLHVGDRPVLELEFDDIEADEAEHRGHRYHGPTCEDVRRIIAWAQAAKRHARDGILCHCMQGQSRSPAAAYIFKCLELGKGREADAWKEVLRSAKSRHVSPNRRMIGLAQGLLGDEWDLLAPFEERGDAIED